MFTAKWPGKCPECKNWFDEGDDVGWVDDRVHCEECADWLGEDNLDDNDWGDL